MLARLAAEHLSPGLCIALYGELGSGKTVFASGLIHGLGVDDAVPVTSPTFVIVSEYEARLPVHHVDAYRLSGARDIVHLGSRELFFGEAISVVEWADRIENALPADRMDISFEITGPTARRISISPRGKASREALVSLVKTLQT
ncbi:MAG: tRNA (adenosine(37)-N6)-threonylcarbamoyltransferase complex ATPase subunit type 1 TsaE [Planctomycetes bacterium]|nr:tRNA (adenosine(37)-N6)-threonylcarbamoyltransferase complex ATPase subunit type 1 TsaE [Planctomycetota bacterium]